MDELICDNSVDTRKYMFGVLEAFVRFGNKSVRATATEMKRLVLFTEAQFDENSYA
ncbi:MAG: hypothetical protein J6A11_02275 [Lachnospiraceae bacterium]|nr:hypothetical protein [Lachnospiraceae bacterium]